MRSERALLTAVSLVGLFGCNEPMSSSDGGGRDAATTRDAGGARDAGRADAGSADAGFSDASIAIDSGVGDASIAIDASADGGVPVQVARVQAAQDRLFLAHCTCDPEEFDTAAECAAFDENPVYEACERTAERASDAATSAAFDCIATVYETAASCNEAAACVTGAMNACRNAFNASLDECDNPSLTYASALDACLESELIGGPSACPEVPATSSLGTPVFSGSTLLGGNDYDACGADEGPDRAFAWTAPSTGMFEIDTFGSAFDTTLGVYEGCSGAELACNDDALDGDIGQRSRVRVNLVASQTVTVVIDGYGFSTGAFQINIRAVP